MTIKHSSPAAQSARGAASSPRSTERARALINFEFALNDTDRVLASLTELCLIDYDNGGIHLYATIDREHQPTQVRAVAATWADARTLAYWQHEILIKYGQDCAVIGNADKTELAWLDGLNATTDTPVSYGELDPAFFRNFADAAAYSLTHPEDRAA